MPLNFGPHFGKTLPWILRHNRQWFFWAYEEEFLDKDPLKEEASKIYQGIKEELLDKAPLKEETSKICQGIEQKQLSKNIQRKIKDLFYYGMVIEPALKKRVEEQLQAAIQSLSTCPPKGLKNVRKTLPCQYLFLYAIHDKSACFYIIGGNYYSDDKLLKMLGIQKSKISLRQMNAIFEKVRFDLYNYRTAAIDGEKFSNSAGIRLLKIIIADKCRKGVRCNQRALRSLRETLRVQGVSNFILERLKWRKGKAKTTFASGKLIFIPRKMK